MGFKAHLGIGGKGGAFCSSTLAVYGFYNVSGSFLVALRSCRPLLNIIPQIPFRGNHLDKQMVLFPFSNFSNNHRHACQAVWVDLIQLDLSQKLPYSVQKHHVDAAAATGKFFEVCVAEAVRSPFGRRHLLQNMQALLTFGGGRRLVLSGGAEAVLQVRGPGDVANLGQLLGLSQAAAVAAVTANPASVLRRAEARRAGFRGVAVGKAMGGAGSTAAALAALRPPLPLPVSMSSGGAVAGATGTAGIGGGGGGGGTGGGSGGDGGRGGTVTPKAGAALPTAKAIREPRGASACANGGGGGGSGGGADGRGGGGSSEGGSGGGRRVSSLSAGAGAAAGPGEELEDEDDDNGGGFLAMGSDHSDDAMDV
ncbi:unnamed protein product [Phaeothamnion confervicola]